MISIMLCFIGDYFWMNDKKQQQKQVQLRFVETAR
jgi:hypothetical protein